MSQAIELKGKMISCGDLSYFQNLAPGKVFTWGDQQYKVSQVLHGNPRFTSRKTWTRSRASLARSPWRQVHLKATLIKPDEQAS